MAKVTGIGGVFWKAGDKAGTLDWLRNNLGMELHDWGTMFPWREHADPQREGFTVLSVHSAASDYFDPSPLPFMVNLRVDDLDALLADLKARGIEPVKVFPPDDNGKFAHVMAPGGLKLELWEPAAPNPQTP